MCWYHIDIIVSIIQLQQPSTPGTCSFGGGALADAEQQLLNALLGLQASNLHAFEDELLQSRILWVINFCKNE
jgi:hypothetical protein